MATRLHAQGKVKNSDPQKVANLLAKLATGGGVMVFGFARGQGMEKELLNDEGAAPQTKDGKVKSGSLSDKLLHDQNLQYTLGRTMAANIVLGNFDRLVGLVNFQNMMIDVKTQVLSFVDNVQIRASTFLRDDPGDPAKGRPGSTGLDAFLNWSQVEHVRRFRQGQLQQIVQGVLREFRIYALDNDSTHSTTTWASCPAPTSRSSPRRSRRRSQPSSSRCCVGCRTGRQPSCRSSPTLPHSSEASPPSRSPAWRPTSSPDASTSRGKTR